MLNFYMNFFDYHKIYFFIFYFIIQISFEKKFVLLLLMKEIFIAKFYNKIIESKIEFNKNSKII